MALGVAPAAQAVGPKSRYDAANRCLTLAAGSRLLTVAGDGYRFVRSRNRRSAPIWFKPTVAGSYMLHDLDGRLMTAGADGAVTRADAPGPAAEWTLRRARRSTFTLHAGGAALTVKGDAPATGANAQRFRLLRRRGCRPYPEAEIGARGRRPRPLNRDGTVFGWADAHLHVVSDLRAGGRVISGESFNRYGVTEALGRDEDVHGPGGNLDVTGNLLRDGSPAGSHDPNGWPSFTGWPAHDTYTHQQVYYRWLERAWRSGLRVVTAQLVEDQTICEVQAQKSHSCDETETIALEAQRLRALEAYVDAQSGGPGRGWFRIVDEPRAARRVAARGKLAVLIGVESSSPFGCSEFLGQPQCDEADIDRGIALYRRLGISSLFVAHWVDNAFAGASVEEGATGTFISAFQVETTGHPYSTGPCPDPAYGEECNTKGLTPLGRHLIERLMDAHMLIEVDHLSERARHEVMEIAERRRYPLVSSHTGSGGVWTGSDLKRLYAIGGFATARPDTAAKLASTILRFKVHDGVFGVGIGSDTGGFAAQPGPDPDAEKDPLRYPFRLSGVRFACQVSGTRTFDLNKDGVAHYGLYPDLIAHMRQKPGGPEAARILFRSAEAYLRTWERAHGLRRG